MGGNCLRQLDDNAHRGCNDNKINLFKSTVKPYPIAIYQPELLGFL
jgi:hypothetical protein